MTNPAWLETAKSMGASAARAAATWVTDGNESNESRERKLKAIREGDPAVDQMLPAEPNLSGEYADSLTGDKLVGLVTGEHPDDVSEEDIDSICEAWEEAVQENFVSACEAELLKWLPSDPEEG